MQSPDGCEQDNQAPHDRISRLSAATLRISDSLDLDTVLHEVVEGARALTCARFGVIATLDDARPARGLRQLRPLRRRAPAARSLA